MKERERERKKERGRERNTEHEKKREREKRRIQYMKRNERDKGMRPTRKQEIGNDRNFDQK